MKNTLEKYLAQRSVHRDWPLANSFDQEKVSMVVVIPALAEFNHLFNTLSALTISSAAIQAQTLVICVINNADPSQARHEDLVNNNWTFQELSACSREKRLCSLMLTWVDASSPGYTLPAGQGVGLARKIGLDHGLRILAGNYRLHAPLIWLDADAPPAPGYLDAVHAYYSSERRWAGYAAYLHRFTNTDAERMAIIDYEIYMRYHEYGLRWAGSPYAYPALGSIISCTAEAYAASGGMNRRLAGEDFYFMQQLTKTGNMAPIPYALVEPSGRVSHRTPFGTGQSVHAYSSPSTSQTLLYHPRCYEVLRVFLILIRANLKSTGKSLLVLCSDLHPELAEFLCAHEFERNWDNLQRQHRNESRFLHQFNVWFDGLRTIQLIHQLRKNAFPDVSHQEAFTALMSWIARLVPEYEKYINVSSKMSREEILDLLRHIGMQKHIGADYPMSNSYADFFLRMPAIS